jgi:glycosyltransferase involved in cell wall biosynthesis
MNPSTPKVVCHLSSLHYRKDLRILVRECRSLAVAGYEVHYIVADGQGEETIDGVHIHDVGLRAAFPSRFFTTHRAMREKAWSLNAAVYHFHDPELMILGLKLKRKGAKVIADVHEDVPREFLSSPDKSWLRRQISSFLLDRLEQYSFSQLAAVITSSPLVESRLQPIAKRIINIGCFPDLTEEFPAIPHPIEKTTDLVYIGSIAPLRGIKETVQLLDGTPWRYTLIGDFQGEGTADGIRNLPAWDSQVNYLGFTESRVTIINNLHTARIGMANLLPHYSYATAYCIKIFEYMACGIPVIATNFPFWQTIVDKNECGITVDSTDRAATKAAIQYLLDHPAEAERMGQNGRRAIETKYNWAAEEQKLLQLYTQVLAPQ